MKAMLAGFTAIVVISLVAYYGLEQTGFSSEDVYSGDNVRLN